MAATAGTMLAFGTLALRIGVATSFGLHGIEGKRSWRLQPGGGNGRPMLRLHRLSIAEPPGGIACARALTRAAAIRTTLIMAGAIRTGIVVWKTERTFFEGPVP